MLTDIMDQGRVYNTPPYYVMFNFLLGFGISTAAVLPDVAVGAGDLCWLPH